MCLLIITSNNSSNEVELKRVRGAILPHHNLVGEYIDEFYSELSEEQNQIDKILLISTNHFDTGHHVFQSTDQSTYNVNIDLGIIDNFKRQNLLAVSRGAAKREHGLTVHFDRIQNLFPNTPVTPIMIKWQTPQKALDNLIVEIRNQFDMERTLIIASIDFSHYVTEETSAANDQRTISWLEDWGDSKLSEFNLEDLWDLERSTTMDTDIATAMDSPETFYLITKLIESPSVEIWKRTSSQSIYGGKDPMENTSHLFVRIR